jgi:hypothetical protein
MYPLHPRNSTAPEPYKKVAMAATSTDLTRWNDLQTALAGAFAARAHGIVSVEYILTDRNGREFGRLREAGRVTKLDAGALQATVERNTERGYRMLSGAGAVILTAGPGDRADTLEIECANHPYVARFSLFRNTAVAEDVHGRRMASISGGFAGREYEAVFDTGVEGALAVAILLLHHATTLRRGAYRA